MYQQNLARLQSGVPAQRAMGGAVGDRKPRRLGPAEARCLQRIRNRVDVAGPRERRLRIAAPIGEGDDPLALAQPADVRPERADRARDLETRREGKRRLFLIRSEEHTSELQSIM